MKALVCSELGNPTKSAGLQIKTDVPAPVPELSAGLVRIHVVAASLNFADVLVVQGLYQEQPKLPFIPGSEVSGVVVETGPKVRSLKVGDRVIAVTQTGAFAEQVVVHEGAAIKLPPGADLPSAAGLPIAFGTADIALRDRARIQPGQTVLILGAAGGVGVAAVQIAKAMGCRVVAVARGAAKAEALRKLGADVAIDTEAHPGKQLRALIKATEPKGVDVVFDTVGGAHFEEALKCVKWGAQVLIIGFASGEIPKIAANIALVKNMTLHGIYWGSYMMNKPAVLRTSLQELVKWLAEGKISVPVSHKFPLEEYRQAFGVLLERQVVGKVLIMVGQAPASAL